MLPRIIESFLDKVESACASFDWKLPSLWPSASDTVSPETAAASLLHRQRRVVELAQVPAKPVAEFTFAQTELEDHLAAPDWQPPQLVAVRAKTDLPFGVKNVAGPDGLVFPLVTPVEPREHEKVERAEQRVGCHRLKKGEIVKLLSWEAAALARHFNRV